MNLVIVESPAKAKTINKYLGSDYKVIASYGHIRDLPSKNGSVNPDKDFEMIYEISDKAKKHVSTIADAVKKSNRIYLATDPDREGESISWHIVQALKDKKAIKKDTLIKRVVFNEITKKAVLAAVASPRDIDMDLVNAQQARRALDYLVGFTLSPVLWRKLPGSKSAGRVQSVALRLICERENEIEKFISKEYWDIKANLLTVKKEKFIATLTHLNNKKLDKFDIPNEKEAKSIVALLKVKEFFVEDIEKKKVNRNPYSPFTTSSLQQEASRKLGFSTKHTMSVAQKLYEGVDVDGETIGLITYMRTDGVQLSDEAISATRKLIEENYGKNYVPKDVRIYKNKSKNAQEAHEAIRPTNVFLTPQKVASSLSKDELKLYELIWKRTVACQMESAILDMVTITIGTKDKSTTLRASGSTLSFDGFYKLYREGLDDEEDEEHKLLPQVHKGDALDAENITPHQHFTEPPPRYSEASLVKKMEELGIGRPSTYSAIISVLQDREYVKLEKKRFIPEDRGRLVTAFLTSFFKKYVEYDFTAQLEDQLDNVSAGELDWKKLLRDFWNDFYQSTEEAKEKDFNEILEAIDKLLEHHIFPPRTDGKDSRECPLCSTGRLSLKLGKFGAFVACSSYPDCKYTRQIGSSEASGDEEVTENPTSDTKELGIDKASGLTVTIRKGPYGYYFQLGEADKGRGKEKPKRISIPASLDIEKVDLQTAIGYLSLPREIGMHPETGKPISAGIGKFGPYLLHDGKYHSLPKDEDVLTVGINRAVDIIVSAGNKKTKAAAEPLRIVGIHSDDDKEIAIFDGRYGPYLKHNGNNYKIPKGIAHQDLNLLQAIEIIKKQEEKKK
jgi:DNA topoisomerase-1